MIDNSSLEHVKLSRDSHAARIDTNYIIGNSYLDDMLLDIENILRKQGIYVNFFIQKENKDSYQTEIFAVKEKLHTMPIEHLQNEIGNISFQDREIDNLKNQKSMLLNEAKDIKNKEQLKNWKEKISSFKTNYTKISNVISESLKSKQNEVKALKESLDLDFLLNLPQHVVVQTQKLGDSLLELYQNDVQINKVPETIEEANHQMKKIVFYNSSIEELKKVVAKKIEEEKKSQLFISYKEQLISIVDSIDYVLNGKSLSNQVLSLQNVIEKYSKDEEKISTVDRNVLNSLIKQASSKIVEKEGILISEAYKELEKYANLNKVANENIVSNQKDDAYTPSQITANKETKKYSDNQYDYYNLNKIAEEVSNYNNQKEEKSKYNDNKYDYYNLNKITEEVNNYNSEKGSHEPQEKEKTEKETIVDICLHNPLEFFEIKKRQVEMDSILNDTYKDKLIAYIEKQKGDFKWLFTSHLSPVDIKDSNKVRQFLETADTIIEKEKEEYIKINTTNPLLILDRYKKEALENSELDSSSMETLATYIDELKNEFMWLFASHGATKDYNDKKQVEEFLKTAKQLIEQKKHTLQHSTFENSTQNDRKNIL